MPESFGVRNNFLLKIFLLLVAFAPAQSLRNFLAPAPQRGGILGRMRGKQLRQGIILGVLALIAFWLGSLIWGLSGKAKIAISEARDARRQYEALEARKHTLQANLAALSTERGTDAAIRTAFGVARPGEEVIVVVPPATSAPTTTKPWWRTVLDWF